MNALATRPVLFSVAHSSAAPGVVVRDEDGDETWEWDISRIATFAAVQELAGSVPVSMIDVGPFPARDYDDLKCGAANRLQPRLAIEIHCNAAENVEVNYGEVLHRNGSVNGAAAAACIAVVIGEAFAASRHHSWDWRGARPNTIEKDKHLMFFLERTTCPAVIVEGLFLTHAEQRAWLKNGGAEVYGQLVAAGVKKWLGVP